MHKYYQVLTRAFSMPRMLELLGVIAGTGGQFISEATVSGVATAQGKPGKQGI